MACYVEAAALAFQLAVVVDQFAGSKWARAHSESVEVRNKDEAMWTAHAKTFLQTSALKRGKRETHGCMWT